MAKKLDELKKQYFKLASGVESFSDPLQTPSSATLIKGEVKEMRLTPRVRAFMKGGAIEQAEEQEAIEYRKRQKALQGSAKSAEAGSADVKFTPKQQQQIADALVETIQSAKQSVAANPETQQATAQSENSEGSAAREGAADKDKKGGK